MDTLQTINWGEILDTIWGIILFSIPKVLLFSFIFFILSLVLLWFLKRHNIFSRKNKYWNFAVKIFYVYIPIVFIFFGIACGCVSSSKSYVEKRHKEFLTPLSKAVVSGIVEFLSNKEITKDLQDKEIKVQEFVSEIFGDFQYFPKSNSFIEKQKSYWVNKILARGAKWLFGMACKKALEDISIRLHLDLEIKGDVIEFWEDIIDKLDFSSLDANVPNILTKAIHSKIQSLLTGIYYQLFMTFILFLSIPFIEMLLYFYWVKRKYENL